MCFARNWGKHMGTLTLLGISGSLRRESWNSKLMREAARAFDPATFAEADLRLPLFDDDLQQSEGIPEAVQSLAAVGIESSRLGSLDEIGERSKAVPVPEVAESAAARNGGGEQLQRVRRARLQTVL